MEVKWTKRPRYDELEAGEVTFIEVVVFLMGAMYGLFWLGVLIYGFYSGEIANSLPDDVIFGAPCY